MKETAHHEQYDHFKCKRMHVANITKALDERECLSQTYYLGFKLRKVHVTKTTNTNMKSYVRDRTSF